MEALYNVLASLLLIVLMLITPLTLVMAIRKYILFSKIKNLDSRMEIGPHSQEDVVKLKKLHEQVYSGITDNAKRTSVKEVELLEASNTIRSFGGLFLVSPIAILFSFQFFEVNRSWEGWRILIPLLFFIGVSLIIVGSRINTMVQSNTRTNQIIIFLLSAIVVLLFSPFFIGLLY